MTAPPTATARAWVLPGEPLAVRLMNTVWADRHGVHDSLTRARDVGDWLSATGLATRGVRASSKDLARFRDLRDALRRLAALTTHDARPAAASPVPDADSAVALLNAAAARSPATPRLVLRAGVLHPAETKSARSVDECLSVLAAGAMELLTHADGGLRACHAPGCVLYFRKHRPRREWCSAACGNRARAARHYRRHRSGSAPVGR